MVLFTQITKINRRRYKSCKVDRRLYGPKVPRTVSQARQEVTPTANALRYVSGNQVMEIFPSTKMQCGAPRRLCIIDSFCAARIPFAGHLKQRHPRVPERAASCRGHIAYSISLKDLDEPFPRVKQSNTDLLQSLPFRACRLTRFKPISNRYTLQILSINHKL